LLKSSARISIARYSWLPKLAA